MGRGDVRERSQSSLPAFLAEGDGMRARIRNHDWASTPLGPIESWPQSLCTVVRIMLTSRYAMWMAWGPELTFFCNDAYLPTVGIKRDWVLGSRSDKVWEEIWPDIGPRIEHVLTTGEATWDEGLLLFLERSGFTEETYHTFSYSPLADDSGSITGMLCVVTEVTERVVGERRLGTLRDLGVRLAGARSVDEVLAGVDACLATEGRDLPFALTYLFDERHERLARSSVVGLPKHHPLAPPAIDSADPAGRWPAGEVIATGVPHEVALGTLDPPLIGGPWERPPTDAFIVPIAQQGQSRASGVFIAGLNPFRSLDEDYVGFINLFVAQVASALAGAQSFEAERRRAEALAEIDRAKTLFFSNVSHEFRTPLTLMLGPLEEILSRPDGEIGAWRNDLALMQRNGLRLLRLVNALLDFSRVEAGRFQAKFEPVDLAHLTAELASNFRSAIDKAGLRLTFDGDGLPEHVHVDRDMWEKVVLNLLSNAFKFTFEGEIAVHTKPSSDGKAAEVTIRDTGIGIPHAELPHLFERFRRVEGARGRSIEGSGIGLALVQELVKLHGGTIRVDSKVGEGSAFTVSLPFGTRHLPTESIGGPRSGQSSTNVRAQVYLDEALGWLSEDERSAAERLPSSAAEDIDVSATGADAQGQLVVLADDNADMRNYVRRLLQAAGYRVAAYPDGAEALAAIRKHKPDLVLSDVMMPNLDGFGLLAALRSEPDLRDLPILLLSARAGDEAKVEGLSFGADDYLTKPFAARELIARVEVNLRLAEIRRESARALREEANLLERLNKVGTAIAAELELERSVQVVTDAATELSGAAYGAFFYNVATEQGETYTLYALSGAPREAFETFPMPRNTPVFDPTFDGEGLLRSPDITKDPRFGHNAQYDSTHEGHLPVRSYLAAPVVSSAGEVLGGLFFGHPDIDVFDERAERLVAGIAIQAAIGIDKARLYRSAQNEIERRKVVETALRESEAVLENKVVERTAELSTANERLRAEAHERERAEFALRQAQKMEGIGQLTGGVAHDFNNLLTIIIGNLESVQRQLRDPQRPVAALERSAQQAMRGAQRAASLTQRLLAFSRQQPLDPKTIDVNRLVGGMSDLMRRTIGEQVAVETVLAGGLWVVHADPNQLEVAILNLAVNARDAMPDGGKLTIETANAYLDEGYAASQTEVVPGQYVVVAITDNGIGMSKDTLARAFEPFFTTKDVGHGTGLGLSQVYGFVKQSGGHVKLYSELGHGTTVKIYLPRVLSSVAAVEPEQQIQAPGATRTESVLVVEDDDDVRAYTTGILRELGYRVVEAPDAKSALAVLQADPEIKVLFTDVGLPGGMNGRQLADEARRRRPDLRVLFTTGYARNAIVHDGRLDPGVQLITKPFTYVALAAKLRDVIDAAPSSNRILVVEDEVLLQMLAVDSLEEIGFTAQTAGSATAALNKLRLLPDGFDGALIDIGLPDRKGDVLLSEIRALRPSMPVVIVSGQDEVALRARFAGDKLTAVLGKPYQIEQLEAALRGLGLSGDKNRTDDTGQAGG